MRNLLSCFHFAALAAVVAAGVVSAAGAAAKAGTPAVQWRKIGETPGFPGLRQHLQSIVNRRGHDRVAMFCIVLRDSGDNDPLAYALWPQRHLLYRWQATNDPNISDATLLHHEPLDLRKDLVRTQADRLSTYKVTQSWIRNVEAQCSRHGEQVRVLRGQK